MREERKLQNRVIPHNKIPKYQIIFIIMQWNDSSNQFITRHRCFGPYK